MLKRHAPPALATALAAILALPASAETALYPRGEVPPGPGDGGPRRFEVAGIEGALNLRAGPAADAEVLDRLAAGAILTNLGCSAGAARAWCDVQPFTGGARGYVAAEFLKPAIGPNGDVPTGYDDSALRAGQGTFDATGTIPCARASGQPVGACPVGVARGTGGDATVVVTTPDARQRVIFFTHGVAMGTDASEADPTGYDFSAIREGDLTVIRIGPERYEIPDALPLGG